MQEVNQILKFHQGKILKRSYFYALVPSFPWSQTYCNLDMTQKVIESDCITG